ncbi:MAG: hypothetical protein H0U27_04490 [Nitrosopumilus sp.]|nr:hypothetical protein [Nitrosopumilus sp.]
MVTETVQSTMNYYLASITAGTVAGLFTHPIDVWKTRLQTQAWRNSSYLKIMSSNPYSGVGVGLLSYMPSKAISLGTYGLSKNVLQENFNLSNTSVNIIAGTTASIITATIMCPLYVIKTLKQIQQKDGTNAMPSSWSIAKSLWKEGGFKYFYRGLSVSILGSSEMISQFIIYEKFKNSDALSRFNNIIGSDNNFSTSALAGGLSKMTTTVIFYPLDVIRTRMREQGNKNVKSVLNCMIKNGPKSFYNGLFLQI